MQTNENNTEAKTIGEMIAELGGRNGVVAAAHKALTAAGHSYSIRALYQTIERNGENNDVMALALLDAVAAAHETRRALAERRAEMQQRPVRAGGADLTGLVEGLVQRETGQQAAA